jgi:amino acid transporter
MNDTPPPSGPALRKSLGLLDGVAIAASSTAATTSIGIGLGVTAGVVGLHLPAIMLLAFLPILGIAGAYSRLNKVEPNAGNGYVWVGRSLTPWLGFLVGWVNIVATIAFLAYTTAVTGSAMIQLAGEAGVHQAGGLTLDPGSTAQTTAVGIVVLIAVTLTAVTGVRTAARLQTGLLIFEYVVLLGFCGYGIVTGPHAFSLSWFDPFAIPSASALAQGLLLSVFCYWGFEAAFTVNEEVRDPRDASRAGLITLVTMLGLFLLGSIAFQRVLSGPRSPGPGVLRRPPRLPTTGRTPPGRPDVLGGRLAPGGSHPHRARHVRDEPRPHPRPCLVQGQLPLRHSGPRHPADRRAGNGGCGTGAGDTPPRRHDHGHGERSGDRRSALLRAHGPGRRRTLPRSPPRGLAAGCPRGGAAHT